MASVRLLDFELEPIDVPEELEQLATVLAFHRVIRSPEDIIRTASSVEVFLHNTEDLYEVVFSIHREGAEGGPFSNQALWDGEWRIDGTVSGLLADPDEPEIDWGATVTFPVDWTAAMTDALVNTDRPFFTVLDRVSTGFEGHWSTEAKARAMLSAGRDGTGEHGRFDRGVVYQLLKDPCRIVEVEGFDDRAQSAGADK
jgi:hypothetical protein